LTHLWVSGGRVRNVDPAVAAITRWNSKVAFLAECNEKSSGILKVKRLFPYVATTNIAIVAAFEDGWLRVPPVVMVTDPSPPSLPPPPPTNTPTPTATPTVAKKRRKARRCTVKLAPKVLYGFHNLPNKQIML
jgi:hypothetical protein